MKKQKINSKTQKTILRFAYFARQIANKENLNFAAVNLLDQVISAAELSGQVENIKLIHDEALFEITSEWRADHNEALRDGQGIGRAAIKYAKNSCLIGIALSIHTPLIWQVIESVQELVNQYQENRHISDYRITLDKMLRDLLDAEIGNK